ncbi:unnamed protein product [Mytilus coruscus]|uniref:Uncharacterized protein n=1 Tax=Mytilus coruscus TaxID=42192 RepID=A0A6J8EYX4_MYTCO|nr:unnamed protein product [Mytilus coruscus]
MEKEVKISAADRIKLWKAKKIEKMKENNENYYSKKKLSNETKQPKQTLSMTNSAIKRRKERKSKKEKREKETKRKQSYRKSAKKTACMEFRKKHIHPQLSEEEKNKFPVYEHLTDIAVATLCGKDTTNDCFNKACLDRKCTECGVRLLDFSDQELSDHPEVPTVSWEKYEYITVHNKRNLTLVRKCSKPSEMFAHFKHVLDHFAGHQFRAYWQNAQLKSLKENLPQNNCIVIHDYSENYACKERVDVQSTYFQRTEVTIHVSIIYRHSVLELDGVESFPDDPCIVTEHFFIISSDEKHDQCLTNTINRDSVKAYKPIPGIRSLHQVLNSEPEKLTVRYMSCYSCEECVNGNYNMCTNNAIVCKEVVPIRPDDKGTIDDDENDNEYTMSDLIVEGTVLALYTDEENAEFYLLRASSCPEKLRTSEVDDWGVSFRKKNKNHSRTVLQIRLK